MNIWNKYKNYLYKTLNVSGFDIKVITDTNTKKSFFCLDDLLQYCGYVKDEDGVLDSYVVDRYKSRIKLTSFADIYPQFVFVPVEVVNSLPTAVKIVSNGNAKKERATFIIKVALTKFIADCKNRTIEEVAEDTTESYFIFNNNLLSVATYEGRKVVKATDVIRFCGYKDTSVRDNLKEFCVKIETKFGVANFMFVDCFPLVAKSMANETYSARLMKLANYFESQNPLKEKNKISIDKERSVMIVDAKVIPYKEMADCVYFHSTTIQKMVGYKTDKLTDSFKENSFKMEDENYYITVENMKNILDGRMVPEYRENLSKIYHNLYRFA